MTTYTMVTTFNQQRIAFVDLIASAGGFCHCDIDDI